MAQAQSGENQSTSVRTYAPLLILAAGCLIGMVTFGPRSAIGLFQIPMSTGNGWGREVFSFSVVVVTLKRKVGQPFAGAMADRFGTTRVLCVGALLYGLGQVMMAYADTPTSLTVATGGLIGFGLAGCSFNVVLAAFGKVLPEQWRGIAFGAGTAAGSFGQFLFPPIASALIDSVGWQETAILFGLTLMLVLPLSIPLATRALSQEAASSIPKQSISQALSEAFRHKSYVLLVLGFFTCGFQLAFITAHMPAYLNDLGMPAWVGGWTLALIGLANAVGSLMSGYYSSRVPKRYLLAWIYFGRSIAILYFILAPASPANALIFGVAIGLLWLSTVPPTSGLVILMFGPRYMAMLYGFAFFSHQLGGFLGVYLGGSLYEMTGSYIVVWWLSIALGIISALINLPISETAVVRPATANA